MANLNQAGAATQMPLADEGAVRVRGAPLGAWHLCVISDYVLNTLLKDFPERRTGVRRETPLGIGEREAVRAHLGRGHPLGL